MTLFKISWGRMSIWKLYLFRRSFSTKNSPDYNGAVFKKKKFKSQKNLLLVFYKPAVFNGFEDKGLRNISIFVKTQYSAGSLIIFHQVKTLLYFLRIITYFFKAVA